MKRSPRIKLRVSPPNPKDPDEDYAIVAYLQLPGHYKPRKAGASVKKTVRLRDLMGDYVGPDLYIDFDEDNELVGVEILE